MGLSESEQAQLDAMARQLAAEDPRLADRLTQERATRSTGRRALGTLLGVIGLVALVVGISLPGAWSAVVGVAGFLVSLVGVFIATGTSAGQGRAGSQTRDTSRHTQRGTFMERMENRWDRRREQR